MPRAVQITAFGGPEQLQIVDLPVGEPGPGQIRIRHQACGLNFIDVYQRTGLYANPLPLVLGMEGAGVVEAVGAGVTHLRPGDRAAYASNPAGSYSEARVMPALAVVRLPDDIAFDTAAGMMLKGLTAQYLLKRTLPVEGLQPGDHVLFHAAAGGVGLIACQWAKALGLQLIGTAGSDAKCALAKDHGAALHVGDGQNRWSTVHAEDLADLYALALERAPAGSVFNGAHGSAPRLVEIAHAASELGGAGGRVAAWPLDEARKVLWGFADAIASDQVISGEKAKRELGWNPSRASIIDELHAYALAVA